MVFVLWLVVIGMGKGVGGRLGFVIVGGIGSGFMVVGMVGGLEIEA